MAGGFCLPRITGRARLLDCSIMYARAALFLWIPLAASAHPCEPCHAQVVKSYAQTGMGRSMRPPRSEPNGDFRHAASGTQFLIRSVRAGLFQRMIHNGQNSDYRIDAVIGSGDHASCYLARVGDHLFEAPICYYRDRGYDMAPGYEENPAPGYTRPVTLECVQCHSGKPRPIAGSLNRYESPAFEPEAISCDRCHGDPSAHLRRPVPGSIVNPAKLPASRRDSVCEQCHLSGAARVLNPGKSFADFRAGELLEVLTTYVAAEAGPLKVVSHAEQLARSRCARESRGKMWCGTCHDPHVQPGDAAAYFRERCLACHKAAFAAGHPARTSNCLPCHMPSRKTEDGGHTAFTDHLIARRPQAHEAPREIDQLTAWREPPAEYAVRNAAIARVNAGMTDAPRSERTMAELAAAEKKFPEDPAVLTALGTALRAHGEAARAAKIFERVIERQPRDPLAEENAGMAWLEAAEKEKAARHFERALELDPLLLPDIDALLAIYRESGDRAREEALMARVHAAMRTGSSH